MPKTKKTTPFAANRAVAHNLRRAWELRGWTQEQAAEELERNLGVRWSMTSWSSAERSVDGLRPRQFSADEIVAFSLTFGLPVAWWFLPPDDLSPPSLRQDLIMAQIADEVDLQDAYTRRLRDLLQVSGIAAFPRSLTFQMAIKQAIEANATVDLIAFKRTLVDLSEAIDRIVPDEEKEQSDGRS